MKIPTIKLVYHQTSNISISL